MNSEFRYILSRILQRLELGSISRMESSMYFQTWFLNHGLTWGTEYDILVRQLTSNYTIPLLPGTKQPSGEFMAWAMRTLLKIDLTSYTVSQLTLML